jgi:DedD protein
MMDASGHGELGSVRDLARIQEERRPGDGGSRSATFALIVGGLACALVATLAFSPKKASTDAAGGKKSDALAALAAMPQGGPVASTVQPGEVTFPTLLSDRTAPATALAAANAVPPAGSLAGVPLFPPPSASIPPPPPAADRLPVVPLPARHEVRAGAPLSRPKDRLSALAEESADPVSAGAALAGPGSEGGWQLQVSSYRTSAEAEAFATQLRARGHKAHVQKAEIPSRGTWYRVKVGPFSTQQEANRYRSSFEAKEKMPGFVVKSGVDPH